MILARYFSNLLLKFSLLALLVLVAISWFFTFLDELKDTGHGYYGIGQAIHYTLMITPRLLYELLPVATVIGSTSTLGVLANNGELAACRIAGLSQLKIAEMFAKGGLILVLLSLLIGEWAMPLITPKAKNMRSLALTNKISGDALWLKNGNHFINAGAILADNKFDTIYIYEFSEEGRLKANIHAQSGEYQNRKWILYNMARSNIDSMQVTTHTKSLAEWQAPTAVTTDSRNLTNTEAKYMSLPDLIAHIRYLKTNQQNTTIYEQTLWTKLINPVSIIVMILLAIPFIQAHSRNVAIGRRIFAGAIAGTIYHMGCQISINIGLIYGVMPFISATMPTFLLLSLILYKLKTSK